MQNPYHVNINLQSDSESLHIDLKHSYTTLQ